MAIRSNQVESVVAILNNDQLELLMKFVYRGFESPLEGTSGKGFSFCFLVSNCPRL